MKQIKNKNALCFFLIAVAGRAVPLDFVMETRANRELKPTFTIHLSSVPFCEFECGCVLIQKHIKQIRIYIYTCISALERTEIADFFAKFHERAG